MKYIITIIITLISLSASAQTTTPAWFQYGDTTLYSSGTQRFTTLKQMKGYLVMNGKECYWLDGDKNRMASKYKVYTKPSDVVTVNRSLLDDSVSNFIISQQFRTKNLEIAVDSLQKVIAIMNSEVTPVVYPLATEGRLKPLYIDPAFLNKLQLKN